MSGPRIIAGKAGGLRLKSVPGDSTRPITDRVKESLFNILGRDIEDTSFLDLFGGTGSVGIEALSRSAGFVRMIDNQHAAVATIRGNLKHTQLEANAQVIHGDTLSLLRQPPDRAFEYVYNAPPQYKEIWIQVMSILDSNPGWLTEDGWIIAQIHPVEYKKLELQHFSEFMQRRYGSTLLIFYDRKTRE